MRRARYMEPSRFSTEKTRSRRSRRSSSFPPRVSFVVFLLLLLLRAVTLGLDRVIVLYHAHAARGG